VSKEGVLYEVSKDDGETGAGNVILREIQVAQYKNVCVCVVRWFGGTLLGVDRYAHIQTAARSVLL
jgi:putative IMPACT (imprinted ancient) family translation regulator